MSASGGTLLLEFYGVSIWFFVEQMLRLLISKIERLMVDTDGKVAA